jgi:hypothetical protein
LYEAAGALIVLVSRIATMPRTFWESDELLFAGAVRHFDPWSSHPHPPGYPLYVGLGKFVNFFTNDPFLALRTLSIISCVIGFLALSATFRHVLDDAELAVCGALLFYFSSAVLVHGVLPLSDSPSLMFIALMLYAATAFPDRATQRTAIGLGLACSAAIGTRPQLAVVLLPLFIALLVWTRDARKFAAGVISFGVLSIAWFAPLMDAAGGWTKLTMWETRQVAYVAQHDAAASRGASSAGAVISRFVSHPWGPKWIALPLFALAILGVFALWKIPKQRFFAIAFLTIAHLIVAIAIMDPADAARYSMPHMIGFALLAAAGLRIVRESAQMRIAPFIAVVVAAIASIAYTAPIIRERVSHPSPPIAAANFVKSTFPPNSVVLYDLSTRPHVEELLGARFKTMNVEKGMRELYDSPQTPLVLIGDGGSRDPNARSFAWPPSDAYGKLTRNHFRVVTVDPITPSERFFPVKGVYALERNAQGDEWRWLAPEAVLRLPRAHGGSVAITMQLSHDAPYESNDVRVMINGSERARINIGRSESTVNVPLNANENEIHLVAKESFSPANVLKNQDPRILSVQLIRLQSTHAP